MARNSSHEAHGRIKERISWPSWKSTGENIAQEGSLLVEGVESKVTEELLVLPRSLTFMDDGNKDIDDGWGLEDAVVGEEASAAASGGKFESFADVES